PGHEVVGELLDVVVGLTAGTGVVLDAVLACAARGLEPCESCEGGSTGRCDHVTVGHISPGLQTGYCADTGGGWSRQLVAHRSQLHPVPERMSERKAVLVEPLACAIPAAFRAAPAPGPAVLLVGAGAADAPIEHVVGAVYPLRSWRRAVDHALEAGRLGTAKVAFDPREN